MGDVSMSKYKFLCAQFLRWFSVRITKMEPGILLYANQTNRKKAKIGKTKESREK